MGDIIINEIHYAPIDKTVHEEFIELYNSGDAVTDLSGWHFSRGIHFIFPQGANISPGEYIAVAQHPQTISALYGGGKILGPFQGRLDNEGETVVLRDSNGIVIDRVDYQCGFPWPTAGRPVNFSIELINPSLDNGLGGSWRISDPANINSTIIIDAQEEWLFFKGLSEPSSPVDAWRQMDFTPDPDWHEGSTSMGYGEDFLSTELPDMRHNYSTLYLRKTFEIHDQAAIEHLIIDLLYDDGINVWINGVHVFGDNVASPEMPCTGTANGAIQERDFESFPLPDPDGYLVEGTNVVAIQLLNSSLGTSPDAYIDARLRSTFGAPFGPSPCNRNSVFSAQAAPIMRQAAHFPEEPVSSEPVLITVKVTSETGVSSVELEFQAVDPGSYIALADPEYASQWTHVRMHDDGTGGDETAGDHVFSVVVPEAFQRHRRLVRYRIKATGANGLWIQAPYPDDPVPNFAYFVYDGIPAWRGAINPNSADPATNTVTEYPPALMAGIPGYILITKQSSCENATWLQKYTGDIYKWSGTLVYDGKVYDHIRYRARGGGHRYHMGKNMWKFDFNRGHYFQARDPYGRKYGTTWDKLNFSAIIQQGNFLCRGEQGLFESVGFTLFNLAGVEAPKVHYVTFRIIDEADEFGPDQYTGDFWGLYLVLEQMDGRFLDEHHLPDGNLYKMEGGSGELNNQGVTAASDKSDLNAFMNAYTSTTPSISWWLSNFDLQRYYSYRSIVECIHHYDIAKGKNYFYYLNPETNIWSVLPWDIDLTWADNMYGTGNEDFKTKVLNTSIFNLAYKNRMREIKDLLYNTDQAYQLIEEFGAIVNDPGGGLSLVDADRAMWDYNPVMVDESIVQLRKAGHGKFYERGTPRAFEGMMQLMKDYVVSRGNWIDRMIAEDANIPDTPSVAYAGADHFPVDALSFTTSAFKDPQGDNTFKELKWRIGEVASPGAPPFDPEKPRPYEIQAVWESAYSFFNSELRVPPTLLKIGHTYRVRSKMLDTSFRWSHWSAPVEFTVTPPTAPFPQQRCLRITEVMYNPENGPSHEFIELQNIGDEAVDLNNVSFTDGIEFHFSESRVTSLEPGQFMVIVEDMAAFKAFYDASHILIGGQYTGKLENNGERIELVYGANAIIQAFAYANLDPWPPLANGGGHSLTVADPYADNDLNDPLAWQASSQTGGTPGKPDPGIMPGGLQKPGDVNQDGKLNLADAIGMLNILFGGTQDRLPCNGTLLENGNFSLLNANGDGKVDLADVVHLLSHLFLDGDPHALGAACIELEGCQDICPEKGHY